VTRIPHVDQGAEWARLDDGGRRILLTEILAQVSRDALRSQGLDAVLRCIVDCLVARLPVAVASIILLDAEARHFVHEVAAGAFDLALPAELPWPVTVGAAGRCVRSGEPVLIDDVAHDIDYVPGHPSVRSEYLVPIRHGGRMQGVLNLESPRADLFTPAFCAVFDAIAEQIGGAIHLARVERELEASRRRIEELSMLDGLTGVGNRARFERALAKSWADAADSGAALAILRVDIDGFCALNEACGRPYGDDCLRELARQCQSLLRRDDDVAARLGDDQLVILLPGRDEASVQEEAERLRAAVESVRMNHPASPVSSHLTISVGASSCASVCNKPVEYLLRVADRALRQAKAEGGNRVVVLAA
jgi:diguanylate cyclase (GGDEF)-like protein